MPPIAYLALVLALGILAQWLAWRLRIPSILILLAFGFGLLLSLAFAFGLLLFPRVLGLLYALAHARSHGGVIRLVAGFVGELLLSVLVAPIMMVARTLFVVEIVTGKAVGWSPQRRASAGALASLDRRTVTTSLLGLVGLGLSALLPHPWLVWPLVGPCALAVPLALLFGSEWVGAAARRGGAAAGNSVSSSIPTTPHFPSSFAR